MGMSPQVFSSDSIQHISDIEIGQRPDDIKDFSNLPKHQCQIACPFCGLTGDTVVTKNKLDVFIGISLYILKILLAIALSVLAILLVIIICAMMTREGSGGSHNDCDFLSWYCLLWNPSHNCELDCGCCDCNFGGYKIRRTHSCSGCKAIVGYSK